MHDDKDFLHGREAVLSSYLTHREVTSGDADEARARRRYLLGMMAEAANLLGISSVLIQVHKVLEGHADD